MTALSWWQIGFRYVILFHRALGEMKRSSRTLSVNFRHLPTLPEVGDLYQLRVRSYVLNMTVRNCGLIVRVVLRGKQRNRVIFRGNTQTGSFVELMRNKLLKSFLQYHFSIAHLQKYCVFSCSGILKIVSMYCDRFNFMPSTLALQLVTFRFSILLMYVFVV